MKIEGKERLALTPEQVFRGLDDPAILQSCTPGLTRLEETSKDHYEATLELALPAISGRFEGQVDVTERTPNERMKLTLKGKGPPGFVDGSAELELTPDGDGTLVAYAADVQIGGQVARLGQRMISGVTKELAGQFFETFESRMGPEAAARGSAVAPPKPPNAFVAGLQLLWRTLKNLLGLSSRS